MITRREALALMRSFVGKPRKVLPWLRKRQGLGDCAAGYSYTATGKVQKYIWVSELVGLMKKNGTWKKGSPQPGDAVIYDWNGDGGCDHVAMFHSKNKAGQWIAFGANQGKTKMVSKLVTGKGVILGWGRPFTFAPEEVAAPLKESEIATSRHEMPLQPDQYEKVVEQVAPVVKPVVSVPDAILKEGSTGSLVKDLQKKLGIAVDGDFGPNTRKAVVGFQVKHDLTADGVVGPKTWKVLYEL
jgi:hypothetical protein